MSAEGAGVDGTSVVSTVSTASLSKQALSPQGVGSLSSWRPTPVEIAAGAVVLLGVIALFVSFFARQGKWSYEYSADWGHAYLVPFISGFYVWKHRERFARLPRMTYWPGYAVLVLGAVCYVYFTIGFSNHMFQGAALLLVVSGAVMLLLGPAVFRASVFPIAYLGFGVTLAQMVMEEMTWRLKLLASTGSWVLLNMLGVSTDLEGNILKITDSAGKTTPLNVADACAGMRMVVAFIALAVAVAFFSSDQWWKRIGVLLLAVPVALLMNVVRVTVLGMLSLIDSNLSVGEAHTFIGTLLLIPALGLFMACVWAMDRLVKDEKPAKSKAKGAAA